MQQVNGGTFNAGDYLYLWTRNITDTVTIRKVSIQAQKTGNYNVIMTQLSGTCQYDLKADVTVNPLPEAIITNVSGKKVICEGDSIPLRASISSNNKYDWQRDGVSVLKSTDSKFPVLKSGIYKVEITDGLLRKPLLISVWIYRQCVWKRKLWLSN